MLNPELSVIIPSVNGIEILLECVQSLRRTAATGVALEVLVIERCGDAVRQALAVQVPEVVVIPVPPRTSIPHMRALGFRHAHADAIAVIEDHVLVPADWARRLLDGLASGADVMGGGVLNLATATKVDRVAFLCEYSNMLAPVAGANVDALPGNNVVYRRALLDRYSRLLAEGRWEDHFHAALRRDGIALASRPEIAVGHKMHYRMKDYVTQRYFYSRAYAGMKGTEMTVARRASCAVRSMALPPVLLSRIVRRALAAQLPRAEVITSLPLLCVFVGAWAAGEVAGYVAGSGDAMGRIR